MPSVVSADGDRARSVSATMRILSRTIPCLLSLCVGYVLYLVPEHILRDQLYRQDHNRSLALGLFIAYIIVAVLMVSSYLRTYVMIQTKPGIVPLGPEYARNYQTEVRKRPSGAGQTGRSGGSGGGGGTCGAGRGGAGLQGVDKGRAKRGSTYKAVRSRDGYAEDVEAGLAHSVPYKGADAGFTHTTVCRDPRLDPDSPGLELFYTKHVFECSIDGRPIWCDPCGTWKPERSHHCSEINRCVRKMEHYCVWVGGIVGQNSFKFFLQFTCYAAIFCGLTVGICAYAMARRHALEEGADARIIVGLAIASFLGLFSSAIAVACLQFALTNTTSVEVHQLQRPGRYMAVHIQRGAPPVPSQYDAITYPLPAIGPAPDYKTSDATVSSPPRDDARSVPWTLPIDDEPDPFKVAREARAARRAARDKLACRTFAIVPIPKGMNVWNVGPWANWTSVLGSNPLDWFLPIRNSPCCRHDTLQSPYHISPAFEKLCADLELPPPDDMELMPC